MRSKTRFILFFVLAFFVFILLNSCGTSKKVIENITFEDKTVVYTGDEHAVEIKGALPKGVFVSYENNNKKDVGEYLVTAKFSGESEEYEIPETMTAKLIIIPAKYDHMKFESKEFVYDGLPHSLKVEGLPEGVYAEYTNNRQTEVGEYEVTVKFIGAIKNYEIPETMTATLKIVEYNINNIKLEDKEFVYNGNEHSLVITGALPRGVEVTYTNNIQVNAGTYEVTAIFTDTTGNYEVPEPMTATLTILKKELEITLEDYEATYDGSEHSLEIKETLPEGVTVSYENNNQVNAGIYEVTATFTDTTGNYIINPVKGNLTIFPKELTIEFNDEFPYDGESHSISLKEELPEGITVEFKNNEHTEVGKYDVIVKVNNTNGNYTVDDEMTVVLKINPIEITGIEFNDAYLDYTGETLSLAIEGELPKGVNVTYEGNGQKYPGTYYVTATFIDTTGHYIVPEPMTAMLLINTSVNYEIENGEITIIGDSRTSYHVNIPEQIKVEGEFYKVASIKKGAFEGKVNIREVTLPNTLKVIGKEAFKDCTGLKHLEIPSSVTEIGGYILSGCTSLEGVEIPFIGTEINDEFGSLFSYGSSLTSPQGTYRAKSHSYFSQSYYYIPASLTKVVILGGEISEGAFYKCKGINEIVLPNNIIEIPESAFEDCEGLNNLVVPTSISIVGKKAFKGCSGLTTIYNNSNLNIQIGQETNGYLGYYATTIYNIGEWEYVDGIPTSKVETIE